MVEDYFDNSPIGISGAESLKLIKEYFNEYQKEFALSEENLHEPFWSISYSGNGLKICFEGDAGFATDIFIDGKKCPLFTFDRRVVNAAKTNKKNIQFVLGVLGDFLKST